MPLKSGRLTPQEQTFAAVVASTGDTNYAAAKAGYAHPAQNAHKLMQRTAVVDAIVEEQRIRLQNEALPAAVSCLISLVTDQRAPAGARVHAAKVILDRTLGAQATDSPKEPWEMSGEELARAINELEKLKHEAAVRSKPVLDLPKVDTQPGIFD
ncbi:hypothetical protein [Salinarimonas soli]|uniref:Terminase small subunit n=1 Tax=Salinarimonas soli TaxID=1638099 RepID=A0A5B2VBM1_9HYPH|nr:hypothetical protein [Salinarimonas soli]KAA2235577.1 hypothetical protein F0L46_18930 [Salinarimonas soli]